MSERFLNIPVVLIDDEFRGLIPVMSPEEKVGLEHSILKEGCRDPLALWGNVLIDGHTRYEICTKNNVEFKTVGVDLANRDDVKIWIINNQLSRRNLLPNQIRYLRGIRHNIEKGIPHGGVQNEPCPGRTAERLAEEYGVSASTIKRDAKFAEKINAMAPEEKICALSARQSSKSKAERNSTAYQREPLWRIKKIWNTMSHEEKQDFMQWAQLMPMPGSLS